MIVHGRPFRFVSATTGASCDLVVVSAAEYWNRSQGWPNSLAIEALAQGCIRALAASGNATDAAPRAGVPVLAGLDDAVFASAEVAEGHYRIVCTVEARVGALIKARARMEDDSGRTAAAATLWVSWKSQEQAQ